MRRFLLKLSLYAFLVVSIDYIAGWSMQYVISNIEKGDWGRNNYIANHVKSDVIILGSSRAIHHYDPTIISESLNLSCYNCGEDGMGILLMYIRYNLMCDRHVPKLVIYEFLPDYDYFIDGDNSKYLKFLRTVNKGDIVNSLIHDISSTERYKLLSNLYRYNSNFLDIIAQYCSRNPLTAQEYTYLPLSGEIAYQPLSRQEGQINSMVIDSLKVKYLERLISDCKNNGSQLIFVVSPLLGNDSYSPAFAWLDSLCSLNRIPIYNHYRDTFFCNNPKFFKDPYHLNEVGAESFTRLIAKEIKNGREK